MTDLEKLPWCIVERASGRVVAKFSGADSRRAAEQLMRRMGYSKATHQVVAEYRPGAFQPERPPYQPSPRGDAWWRRRKA